MADGGHVRRSVPGSQADEVVVEDDVHDPVEAVLDVPVGAHGGGELSGRERGGGEVIAPLDAGFATVLALGLDHGDHGEVLEAPFAGEAAVGDKPLHVMADGMAADLDAAMVAVDGLVRVERGRCGGGEEALGLGGQGGPIVLEGEQVIGATVADGFGDPGLAADGVDGDQGAGQFQAFEQRRDGGDLVGLFRAGLLTPYES